jgi:hypothetical protein
MQTVRLTPWLHAGLMIASAAFAVALLADLGSMSRRREQAALDLSPEGIAGSVASMVLDIATATNRIEDPVGGFSVAQPARWQFVTGEEAAPYSIRANGPGGLELRIQAVDFPAEHLGLLKSQLRGIEEDLDADTHIEEISFQGHAALQRTCRIRHQTLYMLDFPAEKRAFHLQFAVPGDALVTFRPIIDEMLLSFRLRSE